MTLEGLKGQATLLVVARSFCFSSPSGQLRLLTRRTL